MRGGQRSLLASVRARQRLTELRCGFCERELVDREHALVWLPASGRSMAKLACDVCQVNLKAVRDMFLASFLEKDEA
jgi:ribosomal protein L37AE/L43A